ncbi:putative periplasmic lipoprotein [Luteirhabdus pelagi]|uniref:hypothetical protein n=1 Tax=Luteirhabdus pelagi TaxID=2792783 RepID=UPI0019399E38|nr:hypothetical protein [Luteirhabdus pelagi]MCT8339104.1 hypothetical protein [Thermobacterium salinum]
MKKAMLFAAGILLLIGCKDNPVSEKIKETKQNVSNTSNVVKEMNKMGDDIKELQEMEPLTNEELKDWLPDEVDGMKRTSFRAGQVSYLKMGSIEAKYATEDKTKQFEISVMDGAGQMGASATAGIRMMLSQDFEEEDEYKTRRTVKHDGQKAIEEYRKGDNNSEIQYLHDNRFFIRAKGTNMDIEETWDAIEEMDVDDLG